MTSAVFWGFLMRSQKAGSEGQIDLFGARLEDLLDSTHPIFVLAGRLDWQRFETKFGVHFADCSGRPALPTRLMVGLEYLKYTMNESDESVVEKFVENPYWRVPQNQERRLCEISCSVDGGGPPRSRHRGGGFKALRAATFKRRGCERRRKAGCSLKLRDMKTNASEPLMTASIGLSDTETKGGQYLWD